MKLQATLDGGPQRLRRPFGEVASGLIERVPVPLIATCAALFHLALYGLANRFPSRPPMLLAETWLDRAAPFWPWTTWVYASSHALVLAVFVLGHAPGARPRFAAVFAATIALSVLAHWAVPVRFPRELFPLEGDGAGTALLRWLRGVDRPTSALPSLHVAMAAVSLLQARREHLRSAPWLTAWAVAIALSTMTTKQHYALDVLAGAALGLAVDWAVGTLAQGMRGRWLKRHRRCSPVG